MKTLIEVMYEESELPVWIGPPRAEALPGVRYITFVNAMKLQDGDRESFVGADLPDAEAVLQRETVKAILTEAKQQGCNCICFRAHTQNGEFRSHEAFFGSFDAGVPVYLPARVHYRTRVAFLNLTQGAYKNGN